MKTLKFRLLVITLLLLSAFYVNADFEKLLHKSWAVNKVDGLKIDSKFSNINFVDNRTDSVTIDILVEIKHLNDDKAEKLAEEIEFTMYLSDGTINAATKFSDKFRTNQEFSITYTINIPSDRNLWVENRYGNVSLGDLNAEGHFEIKYGNIFGNDLMAPDGKEIKLDLKYSNGSFDGINRLMLELGYGKIDIDDVEAGRLETEYSIINIDEISKAIVESKYDNYEIDKTDELTIESKFTGWEIDRLTKKFVIETQYGNVDINQVSPEFEMISVNNRYGNIEISIDENAAYELEGDCYYCKIKHNDGEIIKEIEDNHHTYLKANIGGSNPKSRVKIESRYGKVDLRD